MGRPRFEGIECGMLTAYWRGCRCDKCKRVRSLHEVALRKTRKLLSRNYLPKANSETYRPSQKKLASIDRMMALACRQTRRIA